MRRLFDSKKTKKEPADDFILPHLIALSRRDYGTLDGIPSCEQMYLWYDSLQVWLAQPPLTSLLGVCRTLQREVSRLRVGSFAPTLVIIWADCARNTLRRSSDEESRKLSCLCFPQRNCAVGKRLKNHTRRDRKSVV